MNEQEKKTMIQKYIRRIKQIQPSVDPADYLNEANEVFCALLVELGFEKVVREWQKVGK